MTMTFERVFYSPFSSVLFNEVRYVHTPAELLRVESAAKQNSDIVVGHIPVLGLPGTISILSMYFASRVRFLGWNEASLVSLSEQSTEL